MTLLARNVRELLGRRGAEAQFDTDSMHPAEYPISFPVPGLLYISRFVLSSRCAAFSIGCGLTERVRARCSGQRRERGHRRGSQFAGEDLLGDYTLVQTRHQTCFLYISPLCRDPSPTRRSDTVLGYQLKCCLLCAELADVIAGFGPPRQQASSQQVPGAQGSTLGLCGDAGAV